MPRQHGYRVRLECFVPSDPMDIDRLATVAAAIKRAENDGEPENLLKLGSIEGITIVSQHRNMPAPVTPPVLPDNPDLVPPKQIDADRPDDKAA